MTELNVESWDQRLQKLYLYWRSIHREDGRLPRRQEFDPLAIFDILPYIWMVDIHRNPLRFKFRLMGTENVNAMGWDVTGKWIDEAYPSFHEGVEGYADYVSLAKEKLPSYRKGPAHYHVPEYKHIERIMLPMVDDDDRCNLIVAATVYR
ncbi:PAS domain-containing protein [Aestuariispira ectoiniformans]|uniref:PAS domain-containing protein n=1 Tax=Aestuariispira ectoiniformans TaxID=2775080 RepID=UPI00223C0EA8|nr:PAS domain-containing protein [Aestuariispira ectoiniformans]